MTVLERLVDTAVSAGWLILVVMALRAVFRKAPRWMICLLWSLVALRLACPVSIRSPLSLVPDTGAVVERVIAIAAPEQDRPGAAEPESDLAIPVPVEAGTERPNGPDTGAVATAVWLAGAVGFLGYAAVGYIRLRRRVAASVRIKGNIFLCDWIATPFILGVARPKIYLPSAMAREQYAYVLAHENAHLRRRDHWWKPLGFILLALYWFDPLAWAAYILFCRDMELACDERVVRDMALAERKEYSRVLLSCAAGAVPSVCPVRFGGVGVRARVRSALRYRRPAMGTVIAAGIACAVLAVCFLTDPAKSLAAEAADVSAPATRWVTGEDVAAMNGSDPDEGDFAAMLAEEWTSEGYTALTYEEYKARYDEPLVPLGDAPAGYKNLGTVFVRPEAVWGVVFDRPEDAGIVIVQVLYNANIESAVIIQQWRTDEGDTQPFYFYSDMDELGQPLADSGWYSWQASYLGNVGGTTVNMALCSVQRLGARSCWLALRALWPDW